MKPQVGCTTVRLVRDNKSIKTIMIPRTSYQTSTNKTKPRNDRHRYDASLGLVLFVLVCFFLKFKSVY